LGGELSVEDVEVLDERVDDVVCRWCNHGASVVEIAPSEVAGDAVNHTE
jgi:hypothetical protein